MQIVYHFGDIPDVSFFGACLLPLPLAAWSSRVRISETMHSPPVFLDVESDTMNSDNQKRWFWTHAVALLLEMFCKTRTNSKQRPPSFWDFSDCFLLPHCARCLRSESNSLASNSIRSVSLQSLRVAVSCHARSLIWCRDWQCISPSWFGYPTHGLFSHASSLSFQDLMVITWRSPKERNIH